MFPKWSRGALAVGYRKDSYENVWCKYPSTSQDQGKNLGAMPPKLRLYRSPLATDSDSANPLEGEVIWFPFFEPQRFDSIERSERRRLQHWFIFWAWLVLSNPESTRLNNPFDRPNSSRWRLWWEKEGHPLQKEISRRRRGRRRYVKDDNGRFVHDPDDDDDDDEGYEEGSGDESGTSMGPPPRPIKRKVREDDGHKSRIWARLLTRPETPDSSDVMMSGGLDSSREDSVLETTETSLQGHSHKKSRNTSTCYRLSESPYMDTTTPEPPARGPSSLLNPDACQRRNSVPSMQLDSAQSTYAKDDSLTEEVSNAVVMSENGNLDEHEAFAHAVRASLAPPERPQNSEAESLNQALELSRQSAALDEERRNAKQGKGWAKETAREGSQVKGSAGGDEAEDEVVGEEDGSEAGNE